MRFLLIMCTAILLQSQIFARPTNRLVISDIDDTLKISHVLSSTGKFVRALDVEAPFTGMPTLLQLILAQPDYNTKIIYLSNAPKEIIGVPVMQYVHQSFLANNNFPVGPVILNSSYNQKNHKLNFLRKILTSESVGEVILIGDNGEYDTEIYAQIEKEFSSQINIITFIHQVYSSEPLTFWNWLLRFDRSDETGRGKPLQPGQIGFVTPMEFAWELKKQNRFHTESWQWMVDKILPRVLSAQFAVAGMAMPQSFPSYMKCTDFVWKWEDVPELKILMQTLQKRCAQ